MGNDGGSIPKRRELVKEAARNPTAAQVKETRSEHQDHLWNVDPLSAKPLAQPVVSDALGRLFNKDSVIEFLLPSDDGDETTKAEHEALLQGAIRSLKDVVEVKFELDSFTEAESRARAGGIRRTEKWVCPVTREELGPATKAVYLVPCGHAFSASAVKEISGEACLSCSQPYAPNDVIPILPVDGTDIARLALRTQTLKDKGLAHSLKKASGGKKRKPADEAKAKGDGKNDKKDASNGIKNASTASLTQRVLQEQEERNKRRKMEKNDNINSLFSKKDGSGKPRDIDFMNRGFAIPGRQ